MKNIALACSVLALGLSFTGHQGSAQAHSRPLLTLSEESIPANAEIGPDVIDCDCVRRTCC
jgi:hypothetical protein